MPTPAQIRAAQINAARRRTPRAIRVQFEAAANSVTIYFDREMDVTAPSNIVVTVCDGIAGRRVEFTSGFVWNSGPQNLFSDGGVDIGPYTGPSFLVISSAGNLKAKGRRWLILNGERCERVEFI